MYAVSSKPKAHLILTGAIAIFVQIIAAFIFYGWAKEHDLLNQSQSLLLTIAIGSSLFVICQLVVVAYLTKKFLSYIAWIEEENALYASDKFEESHSLRSQLRRVFGFAQLLQRKHNDRLNTEGKEFLKYIYISAKVMTKGLQAKNEWAVTKNGIFQKENIAHVRFNTTASHRIHLSYCPAKTA